MLISIVMLLVWFGLFHLRAQRRKAKYLDTLDLVHMYGVTETQCYKSLHKS